MKKTILGILVLILVWSCSQEKSAFVDNTKLVNDYQEKKDFEASYQKRIDAYNKKRDSLSQLLQIEASQFQAEANKLSQKVAQEKYNQILQKQQFMQQQFSLEEQQLRKEGQDKIDSLVKKVKNFVKDYGEENGYTYILGANEAGSVLYGKSEKDLTETLLKALNDQYSSQK